MMRKRMRGVVIAVVGIFEDIFYLDYGLESSLR